MEGGGYNPYTSTASPAPVLAPLPATPATIPSANASHEAKIAAMRAALASGQVGAADIGTALTAPEPAAPLIVPEPAAPPADPVAPVPSVSLGGLQQMAQGQGAGIPGAAEPVNPALAAMMEMAKRKGGWGQQVVLGRTSSGGKSVTKGIKSLPELVPALQRSAEAQQAAAITERDALATKAEATAALQRAHAEDLAARDKVFQAKEAETQANIDALDSEAAVVREELAQMKVDPGKWWASRSTGQKIALGLSAMINGFLQGYKGDTGPNQTMLLVERAIDRDINVQKANIAKKKGDLGDVRGVVADLYKRTGDMRQAETQARIMGMELLRTKTAALEQTAASDLAMAAGAKAGAMIDERLVSLKNAAYQQAQDRVTRTSQGTTKSVPLFSLLQKAQAKGPAKVKEVSQAGIKDLSNQMESLQKLRQLKLAYTKMHPTAAGALGARIAPDSASYKAILDRTKVSYVKAMAGAAASDSERQQLSDTFAGGIGLRETYKSGLEKIDGHINDVASKLRMNVNALKAFGYQVPLKLGTTQRGTAQ